MKTAKQIANEAYERYLDMPRTTVADEDAAWARYQQELEDHGIVATLAGYRFSKDLIKNRGAKR